MEEKTAGQINVMCKCKREAKISLSTVLKQNSIYQRVAGTTVTYA